MKRGAGAPLSNTLSRRLRHLSPAFEFAHRLFRKSRIPAQIVGFENRLNGREAVSGYRSDLDFRTSSRCQSGDCRASKVMEGEMREPELVFDLGELGRESALPLLTPGTGQNVAAGRPLPLGVQSCF